MTAEGTYLPRIGPCCPKKPEPIEEFTARPARMWSAADGTDPIQDLIAFNQHLREKLNER